jgi:hypothetical protein
MRKSLKFLGFLFFLIGTLLLSQALMAQENKQVLAKGSQNPFSNLISLPLQNNMTFPVKPGNDVQNILDIQPTIPVTLGPVMMINQIVLPIVVQPEVTAGGPSAFGIGDIEYQFVLSNSKAKNFFWGVGATTVFPTASSQLTGQGKLSLGPILGFQLDIDAWVAGVLLNNVWSLAGDESRAGVNQMQLEPSVNYNFKSGWFLTSNPTINANWEAPNNNRWVVPVGGGGGKVFNIGSQSINLTTQFFYNAIRPQGSGKFTWFINLEFLFPKKS